MFMDELEAIDRNRGNFLGGWKRLRGHVKDYYRSDDNPSRQRSIEIHPDYVEMCEPHGGNGRERTARVPE